MIEKFQSREKQVASFEYIWRIEKYLFDLGIERSVLDLLFLGFYDGYGFAFSTAGPGNEVIEFVQSFTKQEIANLPLALAPINSWSGLRPRTP